MWKNESVTFTFLQKYIRRGVQTINVAPKDVVILFQLQLVLKTFSKNFQTVDSVYYFLKIPILCLGEIFVK
jgi:hypothetical protein